MTEKKILSIILFSFIFFCLVNCDNGIKYASKNEIDSVSDSIVYYINQYKNSTSQTNKKSRYLHKAYKLSKKLKDTLKFNYLTDISNLIYYSDTVLFKKINAEKLVLSKRLKDTVRIGKTYYLYGHYYYYVKENIDSAYYSYHIANKAFTKLDKDELSGEMLYCMASIKNDLRDYTGSEKLAFQAIKKLKPLDKKRTLFLCYNLLGINFHYLDEFDKSIFYHQRALKFLNQLESKKNYESTSFNNIGTVYREMGQYSKSIKYLKKGIENNKNLYNESPASYARLLANLTYSRFLNGDTINVEKNLKKALRIRDSIHKISGIVINKIQLAEYYTFKRDTIKAIIYCKEAEKLAVDIDDYEDQLTALKLLSKLDKKNANNYLESYINLNDSLHANERTIRNKFTRIEYETDEYIEETKRLTTQNILISVIAAIVVIVLGLLYFIRRQRAKNKELLFEQEQQRANQEIYDLMQKRQTNLREGRQEERHRISEELHDGILGKLFGTRVGMGYLSLTGDQEDVKEYKSYLDELQGIEKEIRDISHALKNNILKSDNSFVAVIEDYLSNQSKVHGFNYSNKSKKDINWAEIDDKLKVTLYRIVQEAIQNVVKHAAANNVTLVFSKTEKQLHLNVTDDGKGFNSTQGKKGIGLKNMEARILKHYGTLHLDSKEGEGTSITISVAI